MKIAVLTGGSSDERSVSLSSGAAVAAALREAAHEVVAFDLSTGVISREEETRILSAGVGAAPVHGESLGLLSTLGTAALKQDAAMRDAEVFFLALHGGQGEGGTLQAILDVSGRPYTGSGMLGATLAMDKDITKRLLEHAGVRTPKWMSGIQDPQVAAAVIGLPMIVKVSSGGSSLRLTLAHDMQELGAATKEAESFGDLVIYESYIKGREYTVGILGGEALPVGEIIPEHELFDYECKYQPGLAQEIFPADLDPVIATRLQERALRVHQVLRLRDYSRVDFIVDAQGDEWCLEANTLPGMTPNSLLPKGAKAAGISFPELCDRIAKLALTRAGRSS